KGVDGSQTFFTKLIVSPVECRNGPQQNLPGRKGTVARDLGKTQSLIINRSGGHGLQGHSQGCCRLAQRMFRRKSTALGQRSQINDLRSNSSMDGGPLLFRESGIVQRL